MEGTTISRLWTDRIIAGKTSYDEVPAKLKAEVAKCLKNRGHDKLVTK